MIKILSIVLCDLPNEYFEKYNIEVVPLLINIEGKEYKDKIDISLDELYNELKSGKDIKTSQPNIQDVYNTLIKHRK